MDAVLHAERLSGKGKRMHEREIDVLPDGAMIARDGEAFAVRSARLLRWTPTGYAAPERRPRGGIVNVLTPPAVLSVLSAGYAPHWHPSGLLRLQ
jgi:hypothetical protein